MKKIFSFRFLIMLAMLFGALSAVAENRFYLNPMTINVGETVSLDFQLDNSSEYFGFQADIEMPAGL